MKMEAGGGNMPVKEAKEAVGHNNYDDYSESHQVITVLNEIYDSIGDHEGGVLLCITDAIRHFKKHMPKDSDYENTEPLPLLQPVSSGPDAVTVGDDGITLNRSEFDTVTEMCQYARVDLLISKEFMSLCNVLLKNFHGIKASSICDLKVIHSRMKTGEYENTETLFAADVQEVWSKLLRVGKELIFIANSLSDMSRSCSAEVPCSAFKTFERVYDEIYLQGIFTVLSQWPARPLRPVLKLLNFLNLLLDDSLSDTDDEIAKIIALKSLRKVDEFLLSILKYSPIDYQLTLDELSNRLPEALAMFGGVSQDCRDVAERILDHFALCSGVRMLSSFGKALVDLSDDNEFLGYLGVASLIHGFTTVFEHLQKQQYVLIKETTAVILRALKDVDPKFESIREYEILLDSLLVMAESIHAEGRVCEKLRAVLGLFFLEITTLVSKNCDISKGRGYVKQLAILVPYCALSYIGLITGADVDKMSELVNEDEGDSNFTSLSDVKLGALLSVVWGHAFDDIAKVAEQDLTAMMDELQRNCTKRSQSLEMLEQLLSPDSVALWQVQEPAKDLKSEILKVLMRDHDI